MSLKVVLSASDKNNDACLDEIQQCAAAGPTAESVLACCQVCHQGGFRFSSKHCDMLLFSLEMHPEQRVLSLNYSSYLHKTNTIVLIIISAIKPTKYYVLGTLLLKFTNNSSDDARFWHCISLAELIALPNKLTLLIRVVH